MGVMVDQNFLDESLSMSRPVMTVCPFRKICAGWLSWGLIWPVHFANGGNSWPKLRWPTGYCSRWLIGSYFIASQLWRNRYRLVSKNSWPKLRWPTGYCIRWLIGSYFIVSQISCVIYCDVTNIDWSRNVLWRHKYISLSFVYGPKSDPTRLGSVYSSAIESIGKMPFCLGLYLLIYHLDSGLWFVWDFWDHGMFIFFLSFFKVALLFIREQ